MVNNIIRKWAARRAENVRRPHKRVAIMVPTPTAELSDDDLVSFRHLRAHLDHYDKFLIIPKGLQVAIRGFTVIEIDRKFFGSTENHNWLLYRTDFWEHFADYEYVLMYHLDSLVFSDQLADWCDKDYDFIGAPFLKCEDSPWVDAERVGNGGFTLYRVPSILKVLWARYRKDPSKYYEDHFRGSLRVLRKILQPLRAAVPQWLRGPITGPLRNKVKRIDHIQVDNHNNDLFWADEAKRYLPGFKVAPFEEGLKFAFEVVPSTCLERNGGRMPFGCHAWARYDRKFWEERLCEKAMNGSTRSHPPSPIP